MTNQAQLLAQAEAIRDEPLLRLEVRLHGPARTVDTQYGPREERDRLVDLNLPVTTMGWEFIRHLVNEYAKPSFVIVGPQEDA